MSDSGRRWSRAPANRRWRPVLLALGIAMVLAAIGWFVLKVISGGDDPAAPMATATTSVSPPGFPSPSPVATVPAQMPFTDDDAQRIAAALTSDDPQEIATVLAPDVREAFLAKPTEALPGGATVTVLTDRFLAVRPDYASVPLMVGGPEPANLLAILSLVDGEWLVESTEEVA